MSTIQRYIGEMFVPLALLGCSSGDGGYEPVVEEVMTELNIIVQTPETTRAIGDPGADVHETEDWDSLYVIIAYTQKYEDDRSTLTASNDVLWVKMCKTDFEALPAYDSEGKYRALRLNIPEGTVYIYGVTFSAGCLDMGTKMANIKEKTASVAGVESLEIPNNYADGDYDKFCSVATGYCIGTDKEYDLTSNAERLLTIKSELSGDENSVGHTYYYMPLKRLATKIDVQWDTQDAYDNDAKYSDVRVSQFSFKGGNTSVSDSGCGRLFPSLFTKNTSITDKPALIGTLSFVNNTEISQRNGRQYLYVFPDGVSLPTITLQIKATQTTTDATTGETTTSHPEVVRDLKFSSSPEQATWYKVNATVKGLTVSGETTLNNE